ncbi:MAG: HK97 family phage prohead protease [Thiotrichales bacterium]|nr:HK97 family phage prohead protease [Thiotrichales bacterium]
MIEHRDGVTFRVSGRTLAGRALVYGDFAPQFAERFEPGAFGEVRTVAVNLQHDPRIIIAPQALLTDSPRSLDVRADLPPGSAALDLVKRGALSGFSIEFRAKRDRFEAGVRIVEAAELTGLALVDRGAYPQSTAEVRARSGRVMRSSIPYDSDLACECIARSGPGSGGACIPVARFSKVAGDAMAAAIRDAMEEIDIAHSNDDVLAVAGNYRRPLGSAKRGTLRATSTAGALEVEIDLPAGAVGDDLVAANEAAGVIVRPLIDEAKSEYTDTERGREYTRPHLRALLIGATDSKAGWPEPKIDYEGEGRRAAPLPRRRRRWVL